jgi:hypothetical protein
MSRNGEVKHESHPFVEANIATLGARSIMSDDVTLAFRTREIIDALCLRFFFCIHIFGRC